MFRGFAVSALLRLKGYIDVVSKPLAVELETGHIYEPDGDRTIGDVDIGVMLWIEETATGEIRARDTQPRQSWRSRCSIRLLTVLLPRLLLPYVPQALTVLVLGQFLHIRDRVAFVDDLPAQQRLYGILERHDT